MSSTSTVIVTSFHGLGVREIEGLRAQLREVDGQFQVVKNTLARRACAESGTDTLLEYLEGQTALVWADGDAAAVAKALSVFGTATNDRLIMRGGILDGAPISASEVKYLASLPPRIELYARLVAGVASPLQGVVNVLSGLISGLARSLGGYHAQRVAEQPDATPDITAVAVPELAAEETPTAEPQMATDDTTEAVQSPAADDTTDAEPAADETTEGD